MSKGILFDLDGTLWEALGAVHKSANIVRRKYDLNEVTLNTVRKGMGLGKTDLAKLYFPNYEVDEMLGKIEEISNESIKILNEEGGMVYPHLEKTLARLQKKYQLFIVSNASDNGYIKAFMSSSNLERYFDGYIAASEFNLTKAEAIKKVIDDYELDSAIYVGDTKKDQEEANAANIPFIQAKYGFGEDLHTKYSIDKIEDLPNLLEKIEDES